MKRDLELFISDFREIPLAAAMGVASKIPVVEGGPAGSGVVEATIRSMAERLGAMLLGHIFMNLLF